MVDREFYRKGFRKTHFGHSARPRRFVVFSKRNNSPSKTSVLSFSCLIQSLLLVDCAAKLCLLVGELFGGHSLLAHHSVLLPEKHMGGSLWKGGCGSNEACDVTGIDSVPGSTTTKRKGNWNQSKIPYELNKNSHSLMSFRFYFVLSWFHISLFIN